MGVENNIPQDWKMTFLSDITNYIHRGITPKYCENESVFVINQRCIRDHKVSLLNARFHDLSLKNVSDEKRLKSGDILICSTGVGTLGRVAQYKLNDTLATVDSHVTIVRPNDNIFKPFLGLLLSGKEREIEFLAEGTTGQTELPRTSVGLLPIDLPPLPEQKAIAKVLTAFDDKIELLQSQNKTLETMAQTIFKEWFGKYQIGDELPEDWRVGKLGDIVEFSNGKSRPKQQGIFPIYGGNGILGYSDKYNSEGEVIIIGRVGAYCGSIYLENKRIWISDNAISAKPKLKDYLCFILYYLKKINLNNMAEGSSQPLLTQTLLNSLSLTIPSKNIICRFESIISDLIKKIQSNKSQIQSLTKTRDTLLPKLMSGQVRVNNIKQTADA